MIVSGKEALMQVFDRCESGCICRRKFIYMESGWAYVEDIRTEASPDTPPLVSCL